VTVDANAGISAGRDLSITLTSGTLAVQGGQHGTADFDRALASGLDSNTSTTNMNASIKSVGNLAIAVDAGDVAIAGGRANACGPSGAKAACSPSANNLAVANANAEILAGGIKTISASGGLTLTGGTTLAGPNGMASAYALLDPGALTIKVGTAVTLTGGMGANTGATIKAAGPIKLTYGGLSGWVLNGGAGSGLFPDPSSPITPGTFTFTLDAQKSDARVITLGVPVPPAALAPLALAEPLPVLLLLVDPLSSTASGGSGLTASRGTTVAFLEGEPGSDSHETRQRPICR
jgi:hypothetical protein